MRGITQVIGVELKLIVRDPMSAFFALAFPTVMLWVKLRTGKPLPGGLPSVDANVPMLTIFVIGMATLVILPATLAQYRERLVLKRLRATPASPGMLFGAQLAAHVLLAVLGTALIIAVGAIGYGLSSPASVGAVVAAWLLAALSLSGIGLLLAAVVPSGRTATVLGLALFFPMVFISGAVIPFESMGGAMKSIGGMTPMAPAVETIRAAWEGQALSPVSMAVMLGICLVSGGIAIKAFRW
ncbi:ABC transporter permease [Nonomuraea sp. NPDC049480]|uniref:ABC transporter permease n=1 Tax=Nonomuraea sp. NPDC049480 TaxID=3364353 RepID=UPI003799FE1E